MVGKLVTFLFLFFIVLFSYIDGLGQEPFYWQLTEEDGLPSMTIYQVHQDKEGFMWFGTDNGICRYDGKEIETYYHPDLLDNEILTIQEDSWGRIWFRNLAGQIAYWDNNKITISTYKEEGKLFEFLIIDSDLYSYTRTTGENRNHLIHFKKYNISKTGSLSFKFRFDTKSKSGLRRLVISNGRIYGLLANPYYKLIELDLNSKITKRYHIESKEFQNTEPLDFNILDNNKVSILISGSVRKIFQIEKDSLIFQVKHEGDLESTRFYKKKYLPNFAKKHGGRNFLKPFNINYNSISPDFEKNIWIGTNGNGIFIIPNIEIEFYTKINSDLLETPVNVIYSDKKNRLFIGHIDGKYSIIDGGHITQRSLNKELKKIRIISEDLYGNYWFGGDGVGLYMLDSNLNVFKLFKYGGIKDLLFFDKNKVWACFSNDVFNILNIYEPKVDHKKEMNLKKLDLEEILSKRVYDLFKSSNGIWIGSSKGIYKYENGKSVPFLENAEHIPYSVSAITESKDSIIWISTQAHGILGIKNDSVIHRLNKELGLVTDNGNAIIYDEYNSLWIGSKKGVQKLDLNTFEIDLINKYDGLPTNEISAIYARDSILWIGTQKGLMKIPYSAIQKNKTSPQIRINNIAFWEKDTTLLPVYDLKYNQNNINIEFVGITYRNRGNTKYEYRMVGVDTNWISTETRFARYPLLNPGEYEFQVKAINEDGTKSISPAKIQLTINRPWWQMWWFYLLIFIGIVAFIGTFFYLRFQRIYKEEKKQKEFDEKINELRMMALQAQMNPHFVFNALSAIQKFLTTDEREEAMIYLARFAQLIRNIFEHSKEKFITLDEEFEFLNLYLDLEKLRFKDKVNIKFNIDKSINEDDYDLQLPPLLIQPIIENAFKHGLMHKEEEGELKIDFSKDDNFLFCQIEDNGVGRKLAREMGEDKLRQEKPSGLKTAKERLAILNQSTLKLKDLNDLVIQDMKDENQNPIGTKVTLKIKYNNYSK